MKRIKIFDYYCYNLQYFSAQPKDINNLFIKTFLLVVPFTFFFTKQKFATNFSLSL